MISNGKALIKDRFLWESVIEPLERFCKNPLFYGIPRDNSSVLDSANESMVSKMMKKWRMLKKENHLTIDGTLF